VVASFGLQSFCLFSLFVNNNNNNNNNTLKNLKTWFFKAPFLVPQRTFQTRVL